MKTLDEVIDYCEGKQTCGEWVGIADALLYLKEYRDSKATIADVIERYTQAALWHMDEVNKFAAQRFVMEYDNPPLTWEQLKQMKGKPVWVEGEHGCIWNQKAWSLIHLDVENDDIVICVSTDNDVHYEFAIDKEDYGTVWQAYRKER